MKKIIAVNVLVVLIMVSLILGGWYYLNDLANYVSTEDARIAGDLTTIHSPVNGTITKWNVAVGDKVKKGDLIAELQVIGAEENLQAQEKSTQTVSITAPTDGTIVQSNGRVNQSVTANTPLATTVPMDQLYVIANTEEGSLQDVKAGQEVDITVDAHPDQIYSGKVEEKGLVTVSTFSILPSRNASGNYTKVTQKVPVKIRFDNPEKDLVPGLNATVKIHK